MGDLIRESAHGSREALSALVSVCLARNDIPEVERAALVEPLARLAAAHGRADDLLVLAGVLHVRAMHVEATDAERAGSLYDEADELLDGVAKSGADRPTLATVLTIMADAGDEGAAVRLNSLMDGLTPAEAADLSREVRVG